ncbi:ROK family protein [Rhodococcus fascians]|uniref:ROK family protein n=1 Tax=Rhodococcoides fascians TaxID=1828 RepID=UPI00195E9220|nr:ROK family protein [Rhodococcus fascians]MBY3809546.1 ROK family protein [Rhodococcus fascians]MBY3840469.1 ROK family protein [Rhodococcus fascians]MBY3845883.1 ROK family protein [Rhodococcus fascians]MBY3849903.1 ROK family protein [Rhodococcus fascians]
MSFVSADIGGSGVRLVKYRDDNPFEEYRSDANSFDSFIGAIKRVEPRPEGVGISLAGFVNSHSGHVRLSRSAPWSQGEFRNEVSRALNCPVSLMNDGEAHALAIKAMKGLPLGAIALSIGTSLGMGVLDASGKVMRLCSGENWGVGKVQLKSSASNNSVWFALGSHGLR